MSDRYQGMYRTTSARHPNWDYAWHGAYFVTICTQHREPWFGKIEQNIMHPSPIGKIVSTEWLRTPATRPDMNLTLGAYIVMPNHFHGILIIGRNQYNVQDQADGDHCIAAKGRDADPKVRALGDDDVRGPALGGRDTMHRVSTSHPQNQPLSGPTNTPPPKNQFGPQRKNVSSIIRGFKSVVTKQARQTTPLFQWQARFHDHIIRDPKSYNRITQYILNNPEHWEEDRFFQK